VKELWITNLFNAALESGMFTVGEDDLKLNAESLFDRLCADGPIPPMDFVGYAGWPAPETCVNQLLETFGE
jgi:hypothetical protein